ncbi:MAG: hypothetical protein IJ071_13105 [Ruminococcus sp.]|nr:hypothetical protein [Ruminococcus sp.]
MARKMTLEPAIRQAEDADKRVAEAENNLTAAKKKQAASWAKVDEIRAEQEQARFNSLARIAIEKFGENVTAEQFKEMLDTIMINDEISEYINSEKAKQNTK